MAAIHTHTDGAIGWIVIDRPHQRNAITMDMWLKIPDAVAALTGDDTIRAIVLHGAGDVAFAAGADVSDLQKMGSDAQALAAFEAAFEAAQASIEAAAVPVIAAIRGACMGGGMALALACDIRIAGDDARFAIPAARLGLGYAAPAVARLMRAAGPMVAFEVLATAREYTADAARVAGFVNEVVPAHNTLKRAGAVAWQIATNAPLSVRAAKATLAALTRQDGALEAAQAMIERCGASADFAEGRAAFLEKRRPRFHGR